MWLTLFNKYLKRSWPLVILWISSVKMYSLTFSRLFQIFPKRSNTNNCFSLFICAQVQTFPFYSCDFCATFFANTIIVKILIFKITVKVDSVEWKKIMSSLERTCSFTETLFFKNIISPVLQAFLNSYNFDSVDF